MIEKHQLANCNNLKLLKPKIGRQVLFQCGFFLLVFTSAFKQVNDWNMKDPKHVYGVPSVNTHS